MHWEKTKILLLCHADTVHCKICSRHISPTKHITSPSKPDSLWRPELGKEPLGALPAITAVCQQLCCPQCHTYTMTLEEREKSSPSSSPWGINFPVWGPSTLSPDQSGLASVSKITPDDTPGGLSTQLMIEHSLYSESCLYGYGRSGHRTNTAGVRSVGTVKRD